MFVLQVSIAIMQVGYMAAISRLLPPTAFGVYALALVILRLVQHFSDLGFGAAIIQSDSLPVATFRQATGAAVLGSLLFTAIGFGLSPLASLISADQNLVQVLRYLSLIFLINGLGVCHVAWLSREFLFRRLALCEFTAFAVGYCIVGICSAVLGLGVYSLVLAIITQAIVRSLLAILLSRQPFAPAIPRRGVMKLLSFGGRVSVIGFLEFWSENLDVVAIGRYLGAAALGQYNRATSLVGVPALYLGNILSRALLRSFARGTREQSKRGVESSLTILAGVIIPTLGVAAVLASPLVEVALGPGWNTAASILPAICMAMAVNTLTQVTGVAAEGQGDLRPKLAIQSLVLISIVTTLGWAIVAEQPLIAYALIWAAGETLRHVLYLIYLRAYLAVDIAKLLWSYLCAALVAAPSLALCVLVDREIQSALLEVLVAGPLSAAAMLAVVAVWRNCPMRMEIRRLQLVDMVPARRLRAILTRVVG